MSWSTVSWRYTRDHLYYVSKAIIDSEVSVLFVFEGMGRGVIVCGILVDEQYLRVG